jgi:hypothetical protein
MHSVAGYGRSKFMDDPKWQLFAKTKVKECYSARVDVCQDGSDCPFLRRRLIRTTLNAGVESDLFRNSSWAKILRVLTDFLCEIVVRQKLEDFGELHCCS